jgi:regulator of sigma E protease
MSIEAVRGRPLSERAMAVSTKIGFALLMMLIIVVFYNDILRVIVPWFKDTLAQ